MKRIARITALAFAAGLVLAGCEGDTSRAVTASGPTRKPVVIPGDASRNLPPSGAKLFTPENPEFARAMIRMADSYKAQGRYAVAEQWYRQALLTMEKAPNPVPDDLATGLERYADLLRETGRADEAAEMEARAGAIRAARAEQEGAAQ